MSENTNHLRYIETQIRLGNYHDALESCSKALGVLNDIKLEDKKPTTYKQPWLLKALGHKDIESVNTQRNDSLILEKFKTKIFESLCLFYLHKTEAGVKKLDNTFNEIEKIKNQLYPNYKEDLIKFIDKINEEIQELYLLSNYVNTSRNKQKNENENINIKKYLNLSEDELYIKIGDLITKEVRDSSKILNSRILLLKSNNSILLPQSSDIKNDKLVESHTFGKKLTSALKKSLYNILCNPKDRVGKKYVTVDSIKTLVSGALISIGLKYNAVITPFAALILMFGIETYCEMSKPKEINNT
ncbi:hypothetical protein [Algibacter sp. Ld11]|uniref:hypothetical protein n=1 Tax=Algibacter sp. Ld11 TaxID=649150 RepID=UPI003868B84B